MTDQAVISPHANRWPKDPEECPTARQIAKALVAAAGQTNELGVLTGLALGADAANARNAIIRCRWLAIEALNVLWPRVGYSAWGRILGGGSRPHTSIASAKAARWWSQDALDQVIAAI